MGPIINAIEDKIKEMKGNSKSIEKNEELKCLSDAALQFRFFKDAYRNHVAHSQEIYEERKALSIMEGTLEFFQSLSSKLKELADL